MAGTYIKLQDAYVSESNKVGSWQLIGYVSPGAASAATEGSTTNFGYLAGQIDADGSAEAVASFNKVTWAARNLVALNDCADQPTAAYSAAHWKITTQASSNGNSLRYEATTTCAQLTPSFDKIGK